MNILKAWQRRWESATRRPYPIRSGNVRWKSIQQLDITDPPTFIDWFWSIIHPQTGDAPCFPSIAATAYKAAYHRFRDRHQDLLAAGSTAEAVRKEAELLGVTRTMQDLPADG